MRTWYLLLVLVLLGCTTSYKINEKDVKRILSALSSDNLEGRGLNSKGIEKAADFIAHEFELIGLENIEGNKNFKQHFTINSTSIQDVDVVINKNHLPKSSYFMKLSDNVISWNEENKPKVIFINADDSFRKKARSAFGSKEDLLVIVSDTHKEIFSQYFSYFSQTTLGFSDKEKQSANLVFVLLNAKEVHSLKIEAKIKKEEKQLTNIVGLIPGNRMNEIVLYSAHYDHLGVGTPVDGDSIYNGANDDASGVTAVIELARYFKSRGKPERTLLFVAFTAEEVGGYGSKFFSKQLNPDEIIAMFNIEMIGKESKKGLNSAWMTGWEKSNLGEILEKNLSKVDFKFFADPYPKQDLFYRSDNATLARLGVPAHSISTTQIDVDKDYHQVSDEIGTLDMANITNTIKAIAIGSQGIVDGMQTPTRVDPETVRN